MKTTDVIIIGAGAAGYTAGLYTSRYKVNNMIISADDGGTGNLAHDVQNWPGEQQITGPELMAKFRDHAAHYGSVLELYKRIKTIEKRGEGDFLLTTEEGEQYQAGAIIIAAGGQRRKLGLPSEELLAGKGVSYCATCDGFFFRNQEIAVIGGGDAAITGVLHLSNIAKKVYVVYRGTAETMKAEPFWIEKVKAMEHVEFVFNAVVEEFVGDDKGLCSIRLTDGRNIAVTGAFVEIGADPNTKWLAHTGIALDPKGFINVDANMRTSIPGIFAAGDITNGSGHFEQFVTAASEGAVAANSAFQYLKGLGR